MNAGIASHLLVPDERKEETQQKFPDSLLHSSFVQLRLERTCRTIPGHVVEQWSFFVITGGNHRIRNNTASSSMATVIFSSTIGTAIEWYDFFFYGTMATLVFPKVFFPETNALVGTILSLFTFLVGFIARPFGGALFGHFGDRIGRKSTLIATLLLMGLSTLIIGFLPGYATLGIVAPLILVLLRLGQGLGVGGEWGGSVLLAMEYGYRRNRGFWASWPQMGVPVGLVLSTVIVNIVQASTGANFLAWGWRIPFFVSAVLVLIGLYIRLKILETPLFARSKTREENRRHPSWRHSVTARQRYCSARAHVSSSRLRSTSSAPS